MEFLDDYFKREREIQRLNTDDDGSLLPKISEVRKTKRRRAAAYDIWRRPMVQPGDEYGRWIKTAHTVNARSQKEADSRMRQKFQGSGFHSMSLLAVKRPNTPSSPEPQTPHTPPCAASSKP